MTPAPASGGRRPEKPYLLLDVDGVLCPWGAALPSHYRPIESDGDVDFVSPHNAREVMKLIEWYDIMWATGRDLDVLRVIGPAHEFPSFPVIDFSESTLSSGQTWKLPIVRRSIGRREMVWVDDELYADAYEWAKVRTKLVAFTGLIQPDSNVGLTDEHFAQLREWGEELSTTRSGQAA